MKMLHRIGRMPVTGTVRATVHRSERSSGGDPWHVSNPSPTLVDACVATLQSNIDGGEACFHVARVGVEKREQDASAPVQVRRSPGPGAAGMVREAFSKGVPR